MRKCKFYSICGFEGNDIDFPQINDHKKMRRLNICLNCKRRRGREYRKSNYKKYRQTERENQKRLRQSPEWKEKNKLYGKSWRENNKEYLKDYRSNLALDYSRRYKKAIRSAVKRNIEFLLTEKEYILEASKKCFYCQFNLGVPVKFCTGLDRVDNSKPYEIGNVVSCCKTCNSIKGDFLSSEETIIAVNAILQFRNQKYK